MGKTFKEILQNIHDVVQQQVDEQDKKGYAELWKHASETVIQQMAKSGFHATDIEYLKGYYIFGHGSNSVMHFHVQECPGWRFGIWWKEPDESEQNYVTGDFFAQYEEIIDKFKPSASSIECHFVVYEESDLDLRVEQELQFIRNEPCLAFCRDYCYWDYNHEYHTREEAKAVFDKWVADTALEKKVNAEYVQLNQQLIIETVRKELQEGEELFLIDRGECWSPRYKFVVYSSITTPGTVYLRDWYSWEEKEKQIQAFIDQYKDEQIWIHQYAVSWHVDVIDQRPDENKFCKKVA